MIDTSTAQNQTEPSYQIRALILDILPVIWQRFLVRTDNTFADSHSALQIVLN